MKKLILLSSLMATNCFAVGVAGHASSHATAHVSEVSAHVAEEATVARIASAHAVYAGHNAEQSSQNKLATLQQQDVPKGVLVCDANRETIPHGWASNKCNISDGWAREDVSIDEFFRRFKPVEASKITMIIYEREGYFEIYYS